MKASDFSKFLTQYLTHYLPVQRNLSSNTIRSYPPLFCCAHQRRLQDSFSQTATIKFIWILK